CLRRVSLTCDPLSRADPACSVIVRPDHPPRHGAAHGSPRRLHPTRLPPRGWTDRHRRWPVTLDRLLLVTSSTSLSVPLPLRRAAQTLRDTRIRQLFRVAGFSRQRRPPPGVSWTREATRPAFGGSGQGSGTCSGASATAQASVAVPTLHRRSVSWRAGAPGRRGG